MGRGPRRRAGVLRDTWHLLGDGQLWISVLGGPRAFHAHEPLAFALTAWAVPAGPPGQVAFRAELWSVALGVLAVFFMLRIAARAGADPREAWFALGLLVASGTLQFGFGYIEAYPVLWVAGLAYLWAGLRTAAGAPAWPASLLLGLGFGVHGTMALFGVSWLWLMRDQTWRTRIVNALVGLVPVALAYVVLPALVGGAAHTEESSKGVKDILNQLSVYPHGVGSYILAQTNRWTLAAPLALPILILGWRQVRARPTSAFCALAAAGMMLFPLLVDTDGSRGAALDWDNFSTAGPALAAAAALAAAGLVATRAAHTARSLALALALFGTFSFVGVNATPRAALDRFQSLMGAPEWTGHTRALASETLAAAYRDRNDWPNAAAWYIRAAREEPGNHRAVRNAASAALRVGRNREAANLYLDLAPVQSGDPRLWFYLGTALEGVASVDSALVAYREAVRLDPGYAEAYGALAGLLERVGSPEALEEAARMRTRMPANR